MKAPILLALASAAAFATTLPAAAQSVTDVIVMRRSIKPPAENLGRNVVWKTTAGSCGAEGLRNQTAQCVRIGTSTSATGCSQASKPAATIKDASCTNITCGPFVQGTWSTDSVHNGQYIEYNVYDQPTALALCQAYGRSVGKPGTCARIGNGVNYYPNLARVVLAGRSDVYAAVCQ